MKAVCVLVFACNEKFLAYRMKWELIYLTSDHMPLTANQVTDELITLTLVILFWLIVKEMDDHQNQFVLQQTMTTWLMLVSDYLAARRFAAWSSLAVSELQLSAATPLWLFHRAASLPSWIEFNCLRSAAVGKAARLSIYWQDAACRLVIPLRQVALAQLNKYHHQSGNVAS